MCEDLLGSLFLGLLLLCDSRSSAVQLFFFSFVVVQFVYPHCGILAVECAINCCQNHHLHNMSFHHSRRVAVAGIVTSNRGAMYIGIVAIAVVG